MQSSQKGHKRTRVKPHVERRLQDMIAAGMGQTSIYDELDREFGKDAPSESTVKRRITHLRPPDPSGIWSVRESNPETAGIVLETIAVVMVRTGGRIREITNGVAEWIVSVVTICPDLPLFEVYRFAWFYNTRALNKESTSDLDAYLAFKPWKSQERHEQYHEAIDHGWITIAPAVLIVHEDGAVESRNELNFLDVLDLKIDALKRDAKAWKEDSDHE